jgi:hypothetical protein
MFEVTSEKERTKTERSNKITRMEEEEAVFLNQILLPRQLVAVD